MADARLAPDVWDALLRLAFQDGDRAVVVKELALARERLTHDGQLDAAQGRAREAERLATQAGAARRAKEAEIEDLNQRAARTEARLASGKLQAEREVAAAVAELANLRAAIAAAEVAWVEASAEEDARSGALPEARAALQLEERAAALRRTVSEREATALEARLAGIDKQRRDAAQQIPAEVRDRYRALFARTQGRPFAYAEAGECSNCKRPLPAAAVQQLRSRSGVPTCPSCGRLLLMQ